MKINKFITIAIGLLLMFGAVSCGHINQNATATQQISATTNDPFIIARAVYADALDAYITAAKSYQDYEVYLQQSNPELAKEIWNSLKEMRRILVDWKRFSELGEVPPSGDVNEFHHYRKIILQVILEMENK